MEGESVSFEQRLWCVCGVSMGTRSVVQWHRVTTSREGIVEECLALVVLHLLVLLLDIKKCPSY